MVRIDLRLYAQTLRRHRVLVLVGVTLTIVLAVLSVARVSPSGVSYRKAEVWSNQATLLLSQEGAPELRSVLPTSGPEGVSSLADTGRFKDLASLYAALATSDSVAVELRRRGLVTRKAVRERRIPVSASSIDSTPMMTITARAPTAAKATRLTVGATNAFLSVLESRQSRDKIPIRNRVQVHVVQAFDTPSLVDPRSKALPMMVLVGGLIATFAAAFVRENLALNQTGTARAPQTGVAEGIAELRPAHPVENDTTSRDAAPLRGPHPLASEHDSSSEIEVASVRRPGRTLGRPTG